MMTNNNNDDNDNDNDTTNNNNDDDNNNNKETTPTPKQHEAERAQTPQTPKLREAAWICTASMLNRHRLNGYLAQRVPSLFLASSFRMCLNCEVLKGMFPWRTRYPLS